MENALARVQENAVFLELCEEGVEMLVLFLGETAEDKDVVYICETEF